MVSDQDQDQCFGYQLTRNYSRTFPNKWHNYLEVTKCTKKTPYLYEIYK